MIYTTELANGQMTMQSDDEMTIQDNNADTEADVFGSNENGVPNENPNSDETVDVKPPVSYGLRERKKVSRNRKRRQMGKKNNAKAKRFKCDQCEYTNAYKSRVEAHRQVHNSEKPFQCVECNGRYAYISNLRVHMRKTHDIILL